MLKTSIAVMLATFTLVNVSYARGGGAETMPMTSYTDLPPYHPAIPLKCAKSLCGLHARHHDAARSY
jgi:hypothetical protein